MKKSLLLFIASAVSLIILLTGCGNIVTPEAIPTATVVTDTAMPTFTLTMTATPDPCAPENIKAGVDKIHRHMREFDDASTLASSTPREQLSGPIANLQQIRRDAEDEVVPPCLANLKDYQIKHMNAVINTLIGFLTIGNPLTIDCASSEQSAESQAICQNIAVAREQHDQYTLELAHILGIPIVTATASVTPSETATP